MARVRNTSSEMNMNTYERILEDLVDTDDRVIVMTAENRGHMRTLPLRIGERFVDVGIAEQTMIGAAAGLALRGRIVLTHALSAFLTMRAFEFIRDDVGIPALPVIMVGMVPGILSDGNGPTHQAIEDVSIMRGIPNVNVFCPADEQDLMLGMRAVALSGQPWYVRYNAAPAPLHHVEPFVIGRAEVMIGADTIRPDVTILTYGVMVRQAVEAAHVLRERDLHVRIVNMRTLKPIDREVIIRAVDESDLVVTLEDHLHVGGLYSIVAEVLLSEKRAGHVLPIDFGDTWFRPARLQEVLAYYGLTGQAIADRISDALVHQHHSFDAE